MTHFAAVNGARISYEEEGSGPPIVLIHAGVTARGMWDEVASLLTDDHRVIRYDLRGFGETVEDTEQEWRMDTDLIGVMDAAGVDRAVVVGVSMGGGAALDAAVSFPERVRGVVAINPGLSGFESDHGEWAITRFKAMNPLWDVGDFEGVARLETEVWLAGPHRSLDDMPADKIDRMREWLLVSYPKEPFSRQQDLDPPTSTRLGEIRCPVLAVLGEFDLPSVGATVDHIATEAPTATKATIEGTAHLSPWEKPEEFARILRQWLVRVA